MSLQPGQALLIKGFFANGSECSYPRPFLIIESSASVIRCLNVSSIKGKAAKLSYPSNKNISNYNPPFMYPSFVKLDELYEIEQFPELSRLLLCGGKTLDQRSLSTIISDFNSYSSANKVLTVSFSKQQLEQRNTLLKGSTYQT